MPYVTETDRNLIKTTGLRNVNTSGRLNFTLTAIIKAYLDTKGLSYSTINDIIGALEGAKLEFYRRVAVPYEDKKIKENGDVY